MLRRNWYNLISSDIYRYNHIEGMQERKYYYNNENNNIIFLNNGKFLEENIIWMYKFGKIFLGLNKSIVNNISYFKKKYSSFNGINRETKKDMVQNIKIKSNESDNKKLSSYFRKLNIEKVLN